MRAVIDDNATIFTLINTFTVTPERQDAVVHPCVTSPSGTPVP